MNDGGTPPFNNHCPPKISVGVTPHSLNNNSVRGWFNWAEDITPQQAADYVTMYDDIENLRISHRLIVGLWEISWPTLDRDVMEDILIDILCEEFERCY